MNDKFVLTRGIDNEFTFTIKEANNVTPMNIVDKSYTTTLDLTPSSTLVPYSAAIEKVDEVVQKLYIYLTEETEVGDNLSLVITANGVAQTEISHTAVYGHGSADLAELSDEIKNSADNGGLSVSFHSTYILLEGASYSDIYSIALTNDSSSRLVVRDSTTSFAGQAGFADVVGSYEKYEVTIDSLVDPVTSATYTTAANMGVAGETWYDADTTTWSVSDGSSWVAASFTFVSATEPVGTTPGETWLDTTNVTTNSFDGSVWTIVSAAPDYLDVLVYPTSPAIYETWYNTYTNELKKYDGIVWNTISQTTDYTLIVDGTSYVVNYDSINYPDKSDVYQDLVTQINASAVDITADMDSNVLRLTGDLYTKAYTVNGDNEFNITEVSTALVPAKGRTTIPSYDATPVVAPVEYVPAVLAHYLADNTPIAVDLTDLLVDYSGLIEKIQIGVHTSIAAVEVSSVDIPLVNSYYDVGTSLTFDVLPTEVTEELSAPLTSFTITILVTLNVSVDSFVASLISLDTDSTVFTCSSATTDTALSRVEVYDAEAGKIKLHIKTSDVNSLTSAKGDYEDRYYLKPKYKLQFACTTTNNGYFVAKVPYVYVD